MKVKDRVKLWENNALNRQLAESEARARQLWEALDDIMQCGVVSQSDLKALVGKHAEHFRKDGGE